MYQIKYNISHKKSNMHAVESHDNHEERHVFHEPDQPQHPHIQQETLA